MTQKFVDFGSMNRGKIHHAISSYLSSIKNIIHSYENHLSFENSHGPGYYEPILNHRVYNPPILSSALKPRCLIDLKSDLSKCTNTIYDRSPLILDAIRKQDNRCLITGNRLRKLGFDLDIDVNGINGVRIIEKEYALAKFFCQTPFVFTNSEKKIDWANTVWDMPNTIDNFVTNTLEKFAIEYHQVADSIAQYIVDSMLKSSLPIAIYPKRINGTQQPHIGIYLIKFCANIDMPRFIGFRICDLLVFDDTIIYGSISLSCLDDLKLPHTIADLIMAKQKQSSHSFDDPAFMGTLNDIISQYCKYKINNESTNDVS